MYVRELTVRYRLKRVPRMWPAGRISTPTDAAQILIPILSSEVVEVCGMLCLSTKTDILAYHQLSRGTVDQAIIHARDVYRTALMANATHVIVAHNHPSGDPTPSPDDIALTRRLQQAGEIVGVHLADHVIVGDRGRFYSFNQGLML